MKLLEAKILKDGHIGKGNVLKVDSFLNHQIDIGFISELGKEFYRLYKDEKITKEEYNKAVNLILKQYNN